MTAVVWMARVCVGCDMTDLVVYACYTPDQAGPAMMARAVTEQAGHRSWNTGACITQPA